MTEKSKQDIQRDRLDQALKEKHDLFAKKNPLLAQVSKDAMFNLNKKKNGRRYSLVNKNSNVVALNKSGRTTNCKRKNIIFNIFTAILHQLYAGPSTSTTKKHRARLNNASDTTLSNLMDITEISIADSVSRLSK